MLGNYAGVVEEQFLTIDPDNIKAELVKRGMVPVLEGYSPMEMAGLMHEESSDISKMVKNAALRLGMNIILDNTMGSDKVEGKVRELLDSGYGVEGIFVDVPISRSVEGAQDRHMNGLIEMLIGGGFGGRYVSPKLQLGSEASPSSLRNSRNRERFDAIAHLFSRVRIYDNSDRLGYPEIDP